jgi:hypothetical protein
LLHAHEDGCEDLVTELLWSQLVDIFSAAAEAFSVADDDLVAVLDFLDHESAHAEYDGGGGTAVDTTTEWDEVAGSLATA